MSVLNKAATTAGIAANATARVVGGVQQTAAGLNSIGKSAADIRNSAVNGLTNVGSGVVGSIPGVAARVGSAAAAVGALGAITGSSGLTNAAGKVMGAVGAVSAGVAAVGAIANTVSTIANLFGGSGSGIGTGGFTGSPMTNPLHAYASYNYLFSLWALTDGEVNSGSKDGSICIVSEQNDQDVVGATTFIDNVRISGVVGLDQQAGNSNAFEVNFKIIEPYSMGKFWESLQTAALQAGNKNYAAAAYMLKIEFKGHFSADELSQTVPNTNKYMHLKIRDISMKVNAKGSEYEISAYPWNEGGMSTSFAEIKTDANISCDDGGPKTVKALLKDSAKSLKEVINKKLKDDKDRKKTVTYAHEIDIVFPPAPYTSNSDGNLIGESELGLNQYNKADSQFAKDGATYDAATGIYQRGQIKIDTKNADFKFAQGSTVQDIINQVILTSDYGRKALEEANQTAQGKVIWWRIETHFHNISPEDGKTGEKAKKVIFRVIPYEVDATIFLPPNTASKAPLEPPVAREFNYIYTGKNYDILDFEISYNTDFYRAFNSDGGRNSESTVLSPANGNAVPTLSGGTPPDKNPDGGTGAEVVRRDKTGTSTAKFGGAGIPDDAATIAARQFHDLATNGQDLMKLDLTILGDPYFIGNSGMGNFTIPGSGPINSEGSINWQEGQVIVKVTFRTPEDANTDTGLYDFAGGKIVREFTGKYRVQEVESTFNRGKFTQRITLYRIPGQPSSVSTPPAGNYPDKNPMPDQPPDP
jgi:hypothetical protein